jgi:hypothetical protein
MHRLFLIVLTCTSAFAGTIGTYIFTGTATGTIGGAPFTSAAFTISAPGDFSTVSCVAGTCDLNVAGGGTSYSIGGIGSGTVTDATYFFDNQTSDLKGSPAGLVGFGDVDDDIQMYGALIGANPVFSTYNLQSAIGPLGPQAADPSAMDWTNLNTPAGLLVVTSLTNFTFQVTVASGGTATPEPGSAVFAGIGLAVLGFWKFRDRVLAR